VTSNVIPITAATRTTRPDEMPRLRRDATTPAGFRNAGDTSAPDRDVTDLEATGTRVAYLTRAVYTIAEVAELLSLSLGSTYSLVRAGEIPAKKMGGRWVVPKRRFHAWLDDLPEASTDDVIRELGRHA
jgi:excisionase family DNA binding protein